MELRKKIYAILDKITDEHILKLIYEILIRVQ